MHTKIFTMLQVLDGSMDLQLTQLPLLYVVVKHIK
jgi:hypothetical protein